MRDLDITLNYGVFLSMVIILTISVTVSIVYYTRDKNDCFVGECYVDGVYNKIHNINSLEYSSIEYRCLDRLKKVKETRKGVKR